ncbi:MAG: AAA family ATPase [Bacteroidales bacterium]|nr:AAA family ATPase [Bacteroidales bacterium]MBN2819907.1 AAA family ATPase [Bacteroidales bacterium]
MLINKIVSKLTVALGEKPTASQEELIKNLARHAVESHEDAIFIVKGYAGTGKTSTLSAYVKVLSEIGNKVILLAPTGRAAKVFSTYAGKSAYTIHKKIYRQKSSNDGFGHFALDKNLHSRTVFIVDEASMISNTKSDGNSFGSGYLLNDLVEYVYNTRNCRLILVGDVAQLPPVGLNISPALDKSEVENYNIKVEETELTDVVRQSKSSGILESATILREKIASEDMSLPLFSVKGYADIESITGMELLEMLNNSYDKNGIDETLVVCRSNKRANAYNQGIRTQILWREEEISAGDLLMVVKNNYYWLKEFEGADFIANGDIVEVLKVIRHKELYGFRFVRCRLRLVDFNIEIETEIILDALHSEAASLSYDDNKKLFYAVMEDYADLKPKKKQYDSVKSNEYFNALQVKYAYAVTCHKAQGGQWKHVFIDAGFLKDEMIDKEYLRWLYTAITRATEKVYLVNFKEEFIEK